MQIIGQNENDQHNADYVERPEPSPKIVIRPVSHEERSIHTEEGDHQKGKIIAVP
jgi:hypothetical protein